MTKTQMKESISEYEILIKRINEIINNGIKDEKHPNYRFPLIIGSIKAVLINAGKRDEKC